ncbi:MAG: AbrB/MazE/SpoVT family DNA-binding domain-containing protein [Clostridia bacterium]|nr:AbrB/MazE/SpoVT family DNA-binding domain-containing protein [Clostridia bacterium]
MKSTGIVRNIDELGRIVIPKEMRKVMRINNGDPIEIFVEGSRIILTKFHTICCFCESEEELTEFRGQSICRECLEQLKSK